jgi:hypothetical protein
MAIATFPYGWTSATTEMMRQPLSLPAGIPVILGDRETAACLAMGSAPAAVSPLRGLAIGIAGKAGDIPSR